MFKIIENSTITKENFNTLSDTLDRLHAVLEAADYDAEFSLITAFGCMVNVIKLFIRHTVDTHNIYKEI